MHCFIQSCESVTFYIKSQTSKMELFLLFFCVVDLCYGSGDPYNWLTDPDSEPGPALFDSGLQEATKNIFLLIIYYVLKLHLHHSSKIKSHKQVTKQDISRFINILLFLLDDRRIRIRANNDGSGGSKTNWTDPAIRIHNTAFFLYDGRIRIRILQRMTDPEGPKTYGSHGSGSSTLVLYITCWYAVALTKLWFTRPAVIYCQIPLKYYRNLIPALLKYERIPWTEWRIFLPPARPRSPALRWSSGAS